MSYPGNDQPPPQGSAPQGGYPPQQGYPFQGQSHPGETYPQQAQGGYPGQGYAQPGYPQQGGPQYGTPQQGPQQGPPPGPPPGPPQYGGPQQGPQYGGPQYGSPQYGGARKKSKGWIVVLALVAVFVVVVLVVVAVLSRAGIIAGGPLAKGVPSVPPPSELPATAGGLYRLDDKVPPTFKAAGAKYDWVVARYYATKPRNQLDDKTPVYTVNVYGPLAKAKDAVVARYNITAVGSGVCADGSPSVPVRVCAVQRGSIVATITENIKPTGRTSTDDELIAYSAALANALS
jgi:hypothetical protein